MALVPLPPGKSVKVASLLRKGLPVLLDKADKGKLVLHVPEVKNTYQYHRDMHFHHLPEIFIQFSGAAKMTLPHQEMVHYPGTFTVIPRGVPHGERCLPYRGPFFNTVLTFGEGKLATHVAREGAGGKPQITNFAQFPASPQEENNRRLDQIVTAYHKDGIARAARLKGLLLTCLAELVEIVTGQELTVQKEHYKVVLCKQLVGARLGEPSLSVTSLAAWVQCSPDYLSNLFHQETGERLTGYINRQRIQRAQHLLKATSLNISEVAWACGYSDPGYFIRIFRRSNGLTPKRFREQPG